MGNELKSLLLCFLRLQLLKSKRKKKRECWLQPSKSWLFTVLERNANTSLVQYSSVENRQFSNLEFRLKVQDASRRGEIYNKFFLINTQQRRKKERLSLNRTRRLSNTLDMIRRKYICRTFAVCICARCYTTAEVSQSQCL